MARITIVSGGGEWTDPWHPFGETSALIAGILRDDGHDVAIRTGVADTLTRLDDSPPDLVVLNAGNAERPTDRDADAVAGLVRYLAAGRPLLVFHVSATAFPEVDEWEHLLGGRWVRGTTMHPDWDHGTVHVTDTEHPITHGLHDFRIWDERYSYLRTDAGDTVLATQDHDGIEHPILWAREHAGARVVYDALGHEARSYESPEHRAIVSRAAAWLLD